MRANLAMLLIEQGLLPLLWLCRIWWISCSLPVGGMQADVNPCIHCHELHCTCWNAWLKCIQRAATAGVQSHTCSPPVCICYSSKRDFSTTDPFTLLNVGWHCLDRSWPAVPSRRDDNVWSNTKTLQCRRAYCEQSSSHSWKHPPQLPRRLQRHLWGR